MPYNSTDHTHTRLTACCPGLPGWASTRKDKPIWISLKQETVSGSGISWAICKSAPRSRQIIMPVPRHSVFYRPDALPATQPTASKHRRQATTLMLNVISDRQIDGKSPTHWRFPLGFTNVCTHNKICRLYQFLGLFLIIDDLGQLKSC